MSSINQGRIKQIRKRQNGSFSVGVPIGTDGILVDMISELDLEQEIRLGGNHYVEINQTEETTEIKEWYFSEARGSRTIEQMSSFVTYSASIIITSTVSTVDIFLGETEQDGAFVTQEFNGDHIVVRGEAVPVNEEKIEMSLYRYNMDSQDGVLIHSKTIYINEDPVTNQIVIDEQIELD